MNTLRVGLASLILGLAAGTAQAQPTWGAESSANPNAGSGTSQRANEAAVRWNAGEDYESLLSELQEDEEITAYGSEVDWLPRDALERSFDAQMADLVFGMAVGERSEPILTEGGTEYTIIEVLGHEERELDPYFRQQLATLAFEEWLEVQQILVERSTYRDRVPSDP